MLSLEYLADIDDDPAGVIAALDAFVDRYDAWAAEQDVGGIAAPCTSRRRRRRDSSSASPPRVCGCAEGVRRLESDPVGTPGIRDGEHRDADADDPQWARLRRQHPRVERADGRRAPRTPTPSRRWRPFQLAFLLLTLESALDEEADDRDIVDLIWFPTGGGKTEAYLGLMALVILHRRLTQGRRWGRHHRHHPLHAATAHQPAVPARRDADLCARMAPAPAARATRDSADLDRRLAGREQQPQHATSDAVELVEKIRNREYTNISFQVEGCPWCGTRLVPDVRRRRTRPGGSRPPTTRSGCAARDRPASSTTQLPGLLGRRGPLRPPAHLSDRHRGQVRAAGLGAEGGRVPRRRQHTGAVADHPGRVPPDLRTAWHRRRPLRGRDRRRHGPSRTPGRRSSPRPPRSVAPTSSPAGSSARSARLFPPAGLSADDSYFVRRDPDSPGRRYVGVMPQGHTPLTGMVHVSAALLQSSEELQFDPPSDDAYWTLVAYHNSLRELGKTVTLAHDDIPARMGVIASAEDAVRPLNDDDIVELTGNVPAAEIPRNLELLTTAARRARGRLVRGLDQHALGRRRRPPAGSDAGRRPAEDHVRVHPGDQPRRASDPGSRRDPLQRQQAARPIALRVVRPLSLRGLPLRRTHLGDPVQRAGAGARASRRARHPRQARARTCRQGDGGRLRRGRPAAEGRCSTSSSDGCRSRTPARRTTWPRHLEELADQWQRDGRTRRSRAAGFGTTAAARRMCTCFAGSRRVGRAGPRSTR